MGSTFSQPVLTEAYPAVLGKEEEIENNPLFSMCCHCFFVLISLSLWLNLNASPLVGCARGCLEASAQCLDVGDLPQVGLCHPLCWSRLTSPPIAFCPRCLPAELTALLSDWEPARLAQQLFDAVLPLDPRDILKLLFHCMVEMKVALKSKP